MVCKDDYIAVATFRKALRRFIRFADEGALEAGLTPQQHQVLLGIAGHPDRDWISVGELAEFLLLKHHAAVGLVDRCQSAGLIERTQDSGDRRVVRVSLTSKGREILANLTQRNLTALAALGKLTAELENLTSPSEISDKP